MKLYNYREKESRKSRVGADVETGEIPVQVRYCTARYTCAGEKEYRRQPDVLKEYNVPLSGNLTAVF